MGRVYYVSYYTDKETAGAFVAANDKINYITEKLVENGFKTEIVSAFGEKSPKKIKAERRTLGCGAVLQTFDVMPYRGIAGRFIRLAKIRRGLENYILENAKEDDIVLIYHSLGYAKLYKRFKNKLKSKLIIETEEIYSDASRTGEKAVQKEIKNLAFADGYLFSAAELNDIVNKEKKPFVVLNGVCREEKRLIAAKSGDKIRVVYAGTLDKNKGGAEIAVRAAEFLPEKYEIIILGGGTDEEIENIRTLADKTNKKSVCSVVYGGVKFGEDYKKAIQSADIGLCTQNPEADFNSSSFPSKILSYLSNGLIVLSAKIPAVEKSAVGKSVYYYDKQTPQSIAEAIMKIDVKNNNRQNELITFLDKRFSYELKDLFDKPKNNR